MWLLKEVYSPKSVFGVKTGHIGNTRSDTWVTPDVIRGEHREQETDSEIFRTSPSITHMPANLTKGFRRDIIES